MDTFMAKDVPLDAMTDTPPTPAEIAAWEAAVAEIMERDGVSSEMASVRLANLLMTGDLKNCKAERARLQAEVARLESENMVLSEKASDLTTVNAGLTDLLGTTQNDLLACRAALAAANAEVARLAAALAECQETTTPPVVVPPTGTAPVWSDEFSIFEMSTPSQAKTWLPNEFDIRNGYEDFAGQSWNANPNQAPFYSPFSIVTTGDRRHLRITAKRRPPEMDGVTSEEWVGGYMITNPALRSFTYGYFEAELRLPNVGKGAFPSFWLYGTDSQREIDIFEIFGEASARWYGTIHETNQGPSATVMNSDRDLRDWHRIGFDWQPGYLRWYYDGVQIHEYTGPLLTKFNRPMSIRLNFAMVPQAWGSWNAPDASTPSPMFYDINYVRYWTTKP